MEDDLAAQAGEGIGHRAGQAAGVGIAIINCRDLAHIQHGRGEARAQLALEAVVMGSAEVAGLVEPAGVSVSIGQKGRGIRWRDHEPAGFADDRQGAFGRQRAVRADDADNRGIGDQTLGRRAPALFGASAVLQQELDITAQQLAITRQQSQLEGALGDIAGPGFGAGQTQDPADQDIFIGADLNTAQGIGAAVVGVGRGAIGSDHKGKQCDDDKTIHDSGSPLEWAGLSVMRQSAIV